MEIAAIRQRAEAYPPDAKADIDYLISQIEQATSDACINHYTEAFQRVWLNYPKQQGKFEAFKNWRLLMASNVPEQAITEVVRMYLADVKKAKTEDRYILKLATLLDPEDRRFDDYLERVVIDPTSEPDWCESAGKLIRNMKPWEYGKYGIPYPLPASLDYKRNFGHT